MDLGIDFEKQYQLDIYPKMNKREISQNNLLA